MNAHFCIHPGAEMKGFSRRCQPRDFRCIHLSSQYIREESGGRAEEVIWLSHPRAGCQTWQRRVPNDYNMLNLLSFSPSCKFFSKKKLTYISPPCPEFRKSSLSLSEGSNEITTPFFFSHCLLQEASPQSSLQGLPAINQNYENEEFYSSEIMHKSTEEQTVNLVPWNRHQCQTECAH